jgi:hypothetical protein
MSHHVVAITEALFAQVANEGTVAVLERRPLTRRLGRSHPRAGELNGAGSGAATQRPTAAAKFGLAEPTLPLLALLLGQQNPLLLLAEPFHLLLPLLGLVFLRIGDAVHGLEVLLYLSLVPVAG